MPDEEIDYSAPRSDGAPEVVTQKYEPSTNLILKMRAQK
jgi:hypothetical protein